MKYDMHYRLEGFCFLILRYLVVEHLYIAFFSWAGATNMDEHFITRKETKNYIIYKVARFD